MATTALPDATALPAALRAMEQRVPTFVQPMFAAHRARVTIVLSNAEATIAAWSAQAFIALADATALPAARSAQVPLAQIRVKATFAA